MDTRYIYVPSAQAYQGKKLTITTENTGGWTISDYPTWMHFNQYSHNVDGTKTITISTNEVIQKVNSHTLTASTMKMDITVQAGKCPLEYVAEHNLVGSAEHLRWATNHDNRQLLRLEH